METTVIESMDVFTARKPNERRYGSGLRRLAGGLVLGLAITAAAFSAFAATPAGAEEPRTYLTYELKNVQVVGFNPQPEPPKEDCNPHPYINVCDETAKPGREPAPPTTPDCNPHPLVNVCDLTVETKFEVAQLHQAADDFTATVCPHDTSPDPVSCKPDLD
jgi:hypothetical protein